MKKITDIERLLLISHYTESDAGFEADCVMVDVANHRDISQREITLANLVHKIYRIIHPRFAKCPHEDWENETRDDVKILLTPQKKINK